VTKIIDGQSDQMILRKMQPFLPFFVPFIVKINNNVHNFRGEKLPKNWKFFCNLQKTTKKIAQLVKIRPIWSP
jgi:hypothetical protein